MCVYQGVCRPSCSYKSQQRVVNVCVWGGRRCACVVLQGSRIQAEGRVWAGHEARLTPLSFQQYVLLA